ncbi:hypothetical protein [Primorskyibacter sp. 2E233]|uniref:hypothetical protein n=1 Tax=Primorskyibacter sp. 2E233 TaxID=3413431 RepID=UPI003BEF4DE3
MRLAAIIPFCLVLAGPASAQDLAERGAKLFVSACLNSEALALDRRSSFEDGVRAVAVADHTFAAAKRQGITKGLSGRPEVTVSRDRTESDYWCHVSSKDLTADDVTKYFAWVQKKAGNGKKPTSTGPAKWDDAPYDRYISGRRAEFKSKGRSLLLEAFHFKSSKGPVGSFTVHIVHSVSDN